MKENIAVFENWNVRRLYDEATETWYFSVVDIVGILTEQTDSRGASYYWGTLKRRINQENPELLTNCQQLKMRSSDGKRYLTDVADAETILRLVQSVPSAKAEPIKLWLARVGYERLREMENPEIAISRARSIWHRQGRSAEWIERRMRNIEVRNALTDYWSDHGITENGDFAALTGITHREWAGITPGEHKKLKGLKSQNLRDHMNLAEITLTTLAEVSTLAIAESRDASGYDENAIAAKDGGGVARKAREELEAKLKQSVITSENFLRTRKRESVTCQ